MAKNGPSNDEDDETFWERYRGLVVVIVVVLALVGFILSKVLGKKSDAPARTQNVTMISLPPLPPPPKPIPTPPPPQSTPPPVDQKMDERPMEPQEDVKPDEAPPKPDSPPDAPLTTNNTGDGPGNNFGLGGGPGGNGGFGGNGSGGKGGSKFGYYAAQVQRRITDALKKNPRTNSSTMRVEVRIWPDSTGRVTRAEMKTSTGDTALDKTIENDVLTGLQLEQPPPPDMRLPIVLRLTASKSI